MDPLEFLGYEPSQLIALSETDDTITVLVDCGIGGIKKHAVNKSELPAKRQPAKKKPAKKKPARK